MRLATKNFSIMKSVRLFFVATVLFRLHFCYHNVLSHSLQQIQLPKDNNTRVIWEPLSLNGSSPHLEAGLFQGLFIRNRTQTLPGQAIAAILFQSLFTMTFREPNFNLSTFDWTVSYPKGGVIFPLNASIHVVSTDLPKPYEMTNNRLSVALSTLGNHFNEHWDLNHMHEWEFDIAICYFSIGAIKIIGRGSIVKGLNAP
ncbi:MAG: hypothetical protein Q9191_000472 [Dirinaria sp. TL-2023a]